MKKRILYLAVIFCLVFSANAFAAGGKIVVANDEWTLSDTGFAVSNQTGTFAANVASWFTGGTSGNFLAYSNNFGLTGSNLAAAMQTAGHNWNNTTAITFDLPAISAYDAVFLAGNAVDNNVLINYVNNGGKVYLAGGTGWGGAGTEADNWNIFLNHFGLNFGQYYNGVSGNISTISDHPIFNGVDNLFQDNGNSINSLPGAQHNKVLVSASGQGMYAVYSAPVPEPLTITLLGAGLLGLAGFKRKESSEK